MMEYFLPGPPLTPSLLPALHTVLPHTQAVSQHVVGRGYNHLFIEASEESPYLVFNLAILSVVCMYVWNAKSAKILVDKIALIIE